jgi:transposase
MDRNEFKQAFMAESEELIDRFMDEASDSLQDMAEMERKIYEGLDRLKAKYLQIWTDRAEDDTGCPTCPGCGRAMRHKGYRKKTSSCVGGEVNVRRKRWWCDACKASFSPSGPGDDSGRAFGDSPGRASGA